MQSESGWCMVGVQGNPGWSYFFLRENGWKTPWDEGPLLIKHIYNLYSAHLLRIWSMFKGLLAGGKTARGPPSQGDQHFAYDGGSSGVPENREAFQSSLPRKMP